MTDRWILILGPLLVVGLLAQSVSVRSCSQAGGVPDASGSTMTDALAATPGACAGTLAVPVVRAVSSEWQGDSTGGALDLDVSGPWTPALVSVADADRSGHRLLVSIVLEALRPVVLQI